MIRLGSNSPTRAFLLKAHNIPFVQNGGTFDEDSITTTDPIEFVKMATQGKFEELFQKYGCVDMPLLVADSVVVCEGKLLRKAKDKEDARAMIELQSGNTTSVVSCMIFKSPTTYLFDISTTTYQFFPFEKEAIDNYINSGECMGKAGAIMVEGFCKPYIKNVEGYESTAMGLCVEKIIPFIKYYSTIK
ncbi:MAG: septum formation inhibitor Maf [Arcobacteraceae bacterium]|jgi:septum formation protein|nr:septum formation inhibitor Maf [Arcobacteraceae bacterium]